MKLIFLIGIIVVVLGFAFFGLANSNKREDKSDTAGSSDGNDGHQGGD